MLHPSIVEHFLEDSNFSVSLKVKQWLEELKLKVEARSPRENVDSSITLVYGAKLIQQQVGAHSFQYEKDCNYISLKDTLKAAKGNSSNSGIWKKELEKNGVLQALIQKYNYIENTRWLSGVFFQDCEKALIYNSNHASPSLIHPELALWTIENSKMLSIQDKDKIVLWVKKLITTIEEKSSNQEEQYINSPILLEEEPDIDVTLGYIEEKSILNPAKLTLKVGEHTFYS